MAALFKPQGLSPQTDDGADGGCFWNASSSSDDDAWDALSFPAVSAYLPPVVEAAGGGVQSSTAIKLKKERQRHPPDEEERPAQKARVLDAAAPPAPGLLQQASTAMRYSRFFEVGFMQALAECAKSTLKGPLTANPAERSKVETRALELAMQLLAQSSEDALGKLSGNDNPRLANSLFLGTRSSEKDNNSAFRELQKKLTVDSMGRRSVLAAARRSLFASVQLHKSRPHPKAWQRQFDAVCGTLSADAPAFAGRLNELRASDVRSSLKLDGWSDEAICEAVTYGRIKADISGAAATTWSLDGQEETLATAKYLKLIDSAAIEFFENKTKSQGLRGATATTRAAGAAAATAAAATAATATTTTAGAQPHQNAARKAAREAKLLSDRMRQAAVKVMENVSCLHHRTTPLLDSIMPNLTMLSVCSWSNVKINDTLSC